MICGRAQMRFRSWYQLMLITVWKSLNTRMGWQGVLRLVGDAGGGQPSDLVSAWRCGRRSCSIVKSVRLPFARVGHWSMLDLVNRRVTRWAEIRCSADFGARPGACLCIHRCIHRHRPVINLRRRRGRDGGGGSVPQLGATVR